MTSRESWSGLGGPLQVSPRARRTKGMGLATAAWCLSELGHPTRLGIYRLLLKVGEQGLSIGEIRTRLVLPASASTLSYHIAHMVRANLIRQEREGRTLRCRVRRETMAALITFMNRECCAGFPGASSPARAPKENGAPSWMRPGGR